MCSTYSAMDKFVKYIVKDIELYVFICNRNFSTIP